MTTKKASFAVGATGVHSSLGAWRPGFIMRNKDISRVLLFVTTALVTFHVVKLNLPAVAVTPVSDMAMIHVNNNMTASGTKPSIQDSAKGDAIQHVQSGDAIQTTTIQPVKLAISSNTTFSTCKNVQRIKNARAACARLGKTTGKLPPAQGAYSHIMVDDLHKVLYCYVPKAGCTSWKHVIALQSGKVDAATLRKNWGIVHEGRAGQVGMRRLSGNKIEDIHRKIKEYTKFLIVRNPLSRIYSAYNDKFIQFYKTYAKVYYRNILKKLYPKLPNINGEPFLSFESLISMIVRAHKKRESFLHLAVIDEHWRGVTDMCNVCGIDYDYIGKIETMEEDKDQLLKLFNATKLPHVHENAKQVTASSNIFKYEKVSMKEAYSKIPRDTFKELVNIFKTDFEIFGYQSSIDDRGPACGYEHGDQCC